METRASEATRQAAYWVVQLRSPDCPAHSEQEFSDWLCASPLHVREYLRAIEVWDGLEDPRVAAANSTRQLVREASTANVIQLPTADPAGESRSEVTPRRARFALRAAAGLVIALGLGYLGWKQFTGLELSTTVGEQRSAVLPDRSIMELNTSSEVRVAFTDTERRVELIRGEAFFEVAKDSARPFIVATDVATARAVGTRFNVYRTPAGTFVTVAEGRVFVHETHSSDSREATSSNPVEVIPGTEAEARPGQPLRTHRTDLQRSLAWRERRLVFDGEPLATVVDEFNRYNSPPLVIVDPTLAHQRISGVFGANDPESLVDFLEKVDHIPVQRSDGKAIRIGSHAPIPEADR